MSLIVSTQSYRNDVPTEYGLLVEIDEVDGTIRRMQRIDTPVNLPNEIGRLKPGLRGISLFGGRLYVTTWNRIVALDVSTFEPVGEISHRWMSDLHGLHVNEDGIWVASTLPDALLLYGFDGRPLKACWFSETNVYPSPRPIDKQLDWRIIGKGFRGFHDFHCNHVEVNAEHVYVTGRGGRTKDGRIYRLPLSWFRDDCAGPCDPELVVRNLYGPHDGVHDHGSIWVTETSNSSVAKIGHNRVLTRFRLRTERGGLIDGIKELRSTMENWLGHPGHRLSHWTRGLAVDDARLFVGQSTWAGSAESAARVLVVNKRTGEIERLLPLNISDYPEARIFQVFSLAGRTIGNERP